MGSVMFFRVSLVDKEDSSCVKPLIPLHFGSYCRPRSPRLPTTVDDVVPNINHAVHADRICE
jgi:hypothetical protein